MRIVIGVTADESWRDALALGSSLCRTHDAEPILAHVFPAPYRFIALGPSDPAWVAHMSQGAEELIEDAVELIRREYGFQEFETVVSGNRSSGVGLMEIAKAHDADRIVIGASPGAPVGRFQIGSTAYQLLHGSEIPVAVAPAGFRRSAARTVSGIVVSFRHGEESLAIVREAGQMAATAKLPLTLLTVLLRHRVYGSKLGPAGEETVMDELHADARRRMEEAAATLPPDVEAKLETVVGNTVLSAVQRREWDPNELLMLPSSNGGLLHRVFLGQTTHQLIRATPIPAVIWPRRSLPASEAV